MSIASSSSNSGSSALPPRARTIRFAPLPDPHRAVLVTDDGGELAIPLPDDNTISTSLLLYSHSPRAWHPEPPLLVAPSVHPHPAASSASSTNSASSSASASVSSTPRTATPSEYSPVSSVGSSPVALHSALPAAPNGKPDLPPAPAQNATASTSTSTSSTQPTPKGRAGMSLLRPFRSKPSTSSSGSSSHSLTPTPSIDAAQSGSSSSGNSSSGHTHAARKALAGFSTEEILTLGTINLFRTSSRDSADSASTATGGWRLARWSSAGGNGSKDTFGSPLARTQSTQSYKSKSKSISLFSSPLSLSSSSSTPSSSSNPSSTTNPSSSSSKSPTTPTASRHKGTRMLNGRVYGSKRGAAAASVNHFASARDEEDTFVEWGYGGMGSVRGAKSAGVSGGGRGGVNWERLQGGAAVREGVGVNGNGGLDSGNGKESGNGNGNGGGRTRASSDDARRREMGIGGTAGLGSVGGVPEEDDGSGMTWVKKRREERERKAREAKEKAEREAEAAKNETAKNDTASANPDEDGMEKAEVLTEEPGEMSLPAAASSSEPQKESKEEEGEEEKEEEVSESQMGTPTPTRSCTADSLSMTAILSPKDAGSEGAVEGDAERKEGQEQEETRETASGMPTPNASVLNAFVFSAPHPPAPTTAPTTTAENQETPAAEELEREQEKEHVPQIVPLPARHHTHGHGHHHHHHHHARTHSRTTSHGSLAGLLSVNSADATPLATPSDEVAPNGGYVSAAPVAEHAHGNVRLSTVSASSSEGDEDSTPSSSSEKADSDDSDSGEFERSEDEFERDDEEEEEENDVEQRRRTMLGAGVEKVMRHKE